MLLLFLSWIYILFTTINLGFILDKIIKTKNNDFAITALFGLFTATVLASFWAIFGRINIEFNLFLLLLNFIIILKFKNQISSIYNSFYLQLKKLKKSLLFFLIIITILIIAQCATIPFLIDNESYYIQTIKWLNEYGFVKGLVNLHFFLGQTSGWHITQSAFNFSFLYKNFNDLSGFCLLLGNIFSIIKLNEYYQNLNKNYLVIGLLPMLNLFFFQFISAPSPDIPVYIISFIVFFYFIECYKNISIEKFNLIVILIIFALYIKTTSLALLLLPLYILITNFKKIFSKIIIATTLSALMFFLFLIKNTIITGFPLYPIKFLEIQGLDYAIPKNVIDFLFNETRHDGFSLTQLEFDSMTNFQIIKKWFFSSIVDGFFNFTSLITVIISPIIIFKFYHKKSIWIIYFTTIIQLILMFLISPQYRYFIHFILFLDLLFLTIIFNNSKIINHLLTYTLIIISVFVFVPINYNTVTNNKLISKNSNFLPENLIFPHNNSKLKNKYLQYKKGNLFYNSPVENDFFFGTGDGNLPCLNKTQLEYFEYYLHVVPQMRSNDLKDGFYAQKVNSNE